MHTNVSCVLQHIYVHIWFGQPMHGKTDSSFFKQSFFFFLLDETFGVTTLPKKIHQGMKREDVPLDQCLIRKTTFFISRLSEATTLILWNKKVGIALSTAISLTHCVNTHIDGHTCFLLFSVLFQAKTIIKSIHLYLYNMKIYTYMCTHMTLVKTIKYSNACLQKSFCYTTTRVFIL